jgi:hypothetical protein
VRKLADDQDNLHAAIRGAVTAGDADTAVGLVGALGWYWWLRSLKTEGAELAAEALAIAGEAPGEGGTDEDGTERLALAYTVGALLAGDSSRSESALQWFRIATELTATVPVPRNPLLRLVGPIRAMFGLVIDGKPAPPDAFDEAVDDADAAGPGARGSSRRARRRWHARRPGAPAVARIRTAVVFPAPFGPRRPSTEPVRTARSIPSSATVSPNRLTSPSAMIE